MTITIAAAAATTAETRKHDLRGPSSLARLALCPGSANLREAHPEIMDADSEDSERGTTMHGLMEHLAKGQTFILAEAAKAGLKPLDLDDLSYAIGKAEELVGEACADMVLSELRLPLDCVGSSHGTADLALVSPWDRGMVIDYKFGRMAVPPPERNLQLKAYAAGLAHAYALPTVTACIIQPRLGLCVQTTFNDIPTIQDEVRAVIAASREPDAPRIPGESQCRFCPVAAVCPEAGGCANAIASLAPVEELRLSQLEAALEQVGPAEAFIGKLREAMYAHLAMGGESRTWTLSKPRSYRSWDPGMDLSVLPEGCVETSARSPAQVQDIVGKEKWKELQKFIKVKPSKPSLVRKSAKGKEKENGN